VGFALGLVLTLQLAFIIPKLGFNLSLFVNGVSLLKVGGYRLSSPASRPFYLSGKSPVSTRRWSFEEE